MSASNRGTSRRPGPPRAARGVPPRAGRPIPRGKKRPTQKVFFYRRLLVFGILLAVLATIVWGILAAINYVQAVKEVQAEAQRKKAYKERIIEPVPCDVKMLKKTVASPPQNVDAGKTIEFDVEVYNPSIDVPCTMDASNKTIGIVIKTGDVTVYDSTKCHAKDDDLQILLAPELDYKKHFTWNTKNYDDTCKEQGESLPGTYRVSMKVGKEIAREEHPFVIN
ncbi:MAG: hypothetical protein Q4P66_03470 [Actinomycetaceae bacterium]|nr:hypothetical protein [Actinomycetaceae bacterium]